MALLAKVIVNETVYTISIESIIELVVEQTKDQNEQSEDELRQYYVTNPEAAANMLFNEEHNISTQTLINAAHKQTEEEQQRDYGLSEDYYGLGIHNLDQ